MTTLTMIIVCITIVLMMLSVVLFPAIVIHFSPEKSIAINTFWIISLLGAIVLIITNCIPLKEVLDKMFESGSINPFKILILFYSMTILSIVLDEYGFFGYVANLVAKKYNKSQRMLLICFYLCVSVLTVFTSNDIIILTFTPFICALCRKLNINPMPYLISEFIAANTLSMMLIIGNPTNIYLGSFYGVEFFEYFKVMALPTIIAAIVALLLILVIFNKDLKKEIVVSDFEVEKIKDKQAVIVSTALLLICIILLAVSSYINMEMYLISLVLCLILLVYTFIKSLLNKNFTVLGKSIKRVPYELCAFVLSMFVIVQAMNKNGILEIIGTFLNNINNDVFSYGISSFLCSNIMNNIPMSVMFSEIIELENSSIGALYASVIGSNLGAYLTPLGALAGIMWLGLLKNEKINLSFGKFIVTTGPISIIVLSVTLMSLSIII